MRDLPVLTDEVEELDGSGLCAVPGLVDCHTHPAFGGDRVEEFSLARGRRDVRGAARGGRRHPLDGPRDACARRGRAPRSRRLHAGGCSRTERRPGRGSRATGSTATPSSRRCASIRRAGGSSTWLGAHAVPPEHADADAYLDFALAEVLPTAAQLADAADVFLERGAFDAAQARRYLEACRDAGLALRLHGDQFTESGAVPLAIELGARSVDHLEATGPAGVAALAASDVDRGAAAGERALPRPADAAGPRARRRRRRDRARDRLQPGQLVHDEPAARLLARLHAAAPLTGGGALRGDGERRARPRAGLAHAGGSHRGSRPTSSCSTPRTGATSPTTWPATSSRR